MQLAFGCPRLITPAYIRERRAAYKKRLRIKWEANHPNKVLAMLRGDQARAHRLANKCAVQEVPTADGREIPVTQVHANRETWWGRTKAALRSAIFRARPLGSAAGAR